MNLIIFDIDDTLTKSEYQHQLAYVNTMKTFGITEINQNWKSYKHHTDSYILKKNYEVNFSDAFDFSFIKNFEKRMTVLMLSLEKISEINGAKNAVNFFTNQTNYAIAFATGSLLEPALVKLKQAKIAHHKDVVVGSNKIYERESIVKKAIDKAKAFYKIKSFNHIIAVGDGIWDLKAAQNLGLHFIGIGMKNYQDFKSENVKIHFKDWHAFNLSKTEQILGIYPPVGKKHK